MATPDTTFAERPLATRSATATVPRTGVLVLPWQRLALGLVLAVAAVLDFWQLNQVGYGNTYYAAAVRSMLQNWHAFFFNSFDPKGFVTIDKPPLGFWLQVASAKLFGYSGLSLMLPQAIAGVLSVALLYHLVARTFGAAAGLLAALALAVMPVNVANRNNIIDSLLVLAVLVGAWSVIRAAETGRLRWLVLTGVLVGLGFNIKMLEAFLVVPAFGILYLLAAPVKWTTRIWHLAVALVVLMAVSLSWSLAVDATPASQRPYVGSSGTNSEINLAFGYNGLERLTGRLFGGGNRSQSGQPTAGTADTGSSQQDQQAALRGFTQGEGGAAGPLRLFNSALGGQVSWLIPLAVLGLIAAAWRTRIRFPLDRRQQALVLWGVWLATQYAFFSVAGFFHSYYMVMMAPSIAALVGIGIVALWQDYRAKGWRGWALPVALLITAATQAYLLSSYPDWSAWLTPLVLGLGLVAAVALVLARLGVRLGARAALAAAALGVLALLAAPTAWAADTVANGSGSGTPTAGPRPQGGQGGFPSVAAQAGGGHGSGGSGGQGRGGGSGGFGGFGGFDGGTTNAALIRYLENHQGTATYLVATLNAMSGAPIIIQTGKPVMALGGFSGQDRIMTPSGLASLVSNGTVRYFLLQGGGRGNRLSRAALEQLPPQVRQFVEGQGGRGSFGGFGGGQNGGLTQWATKNCAVVPSTAWQPATTGPTNSGRNGGVGGFGAAGGQQLYDCASRPTTAGAGGAPTTPSGSSGSGTTPSGASGSAPSASQGQGTARPALMGQWVAGAAGMVTVQSFAGQQSLPTTAQTRYYVVTAASAQHLAVGQRVAVATGRNSPTTATSVTIAPAGGPFISMRSFGFGGGNGGNGGSSGNGGNGGSGGFGGSSGGNGNGGSSGFGGNGGSAPGQVRRIRTALTGTITARQGGAIAIKTTTGALRALQLTPSTVVYRAVGAAPARFQAGDFVAASSLVVNGRQAAADVVESTVTGVMPAIVPGVAGTRTGTGSRGS